MKILEYKHIPIGRGANYLQVLQKWFDEGWTIASTSAMPRADQPHLWEMHFFLEREREETSSR